MEKETLDQAHARLGHTAPRVTLADLEANIATEHYFTAAEGEFGARFCGVMGARTDGNEVVLPEKDGPLALLTICVLVLRNGFTIVQHSAPASPENFNAELGRKLARDNAVRSMWPLMGYALRERLHDAEALRRGGIVDVSQGNTVAGFIGWLSADIPELRNVEVPRLAQSYDRFLARVREDWSQGERAESEGILDRNAFAGMSDAEHGRLGHVYFAETDEWRVPPTAKRGDTVTIKRPAGGVQTDAIYHPGSPGVPPNPVPDPK